MIFVLHSTKSYTIAQLFDKLLREFQHRFWNNVTWVSIPPNTKSKFLRNAQKIQSSKHGGVLASTPLVIHRFFTPPLLCETFCSSYSRCYKARCILTLITSLVQGWWPSASTGYISLIVMKLTFSYLV